MNNVIKLLIKKNLKEMSWKGRHSYENDSGKKKYEQHDQVSRECVMRTSVFGTPDLLTFYCAPMCDLHCKHTHTHTNGLRLCAVGT